MSLLERSTELKAVGAEASSSRVCDNRKRQQTKITWRVDRADSAVRLVVLGNAKSWRLTANATGGSTKEYWNVTSSNIGDKQFAGLSGGPEKPNVIDGSGTSLQNRLAQTSSYKILDTDAE